MSYQKQNFTAGQTLKAAMLNKIEDGIVANEQALAGKQPKGDYLTLDTANNNYQPKGNYLTSEAANNNYQPKGTYLTEHQKLKTINGQSLVGTGNIQISIPSLSGYATEKFVTDKIEEILSNDENNSEIIFDDVVTSIACGGIDAGTSLKGKSLMEVLTVLLGLQEAPKPAVETIMENSIPAYTGLAGSASGAVTYRLLDTATAKYTDQGFYTTTSGGEITNAGYQIAFDGNMDVIAQTFAIPANATIVTAYQYQPAMNQWLETGFDGTHWINSGKVTYTVNGKEVEYINYSYNVDTMGDAITATEYWRFELEV